MSNFSKLGLSQSLLDVLENMGFENPTPVQEKAIPLLLNNNPTDFIGLAQTGTGKTAAFGLPLIDLIDENDRSTQALVMAPTRELGQQTAKQLVDFAKGIRNLNVEVVYGGAAIVNQIKALKNPTQIIVATPGRLLDLINRKAVKLDKVRYVILDEADEMLNMGFKEAIDEILSFTEEGRSIWLFSATMPDDIRRIVKKYMDNPIEVAVNADQKSNVDISHKYVITKQSNKIPALIRFMDLQPEMRGILFCRTKRETQEIADELGNLGYGVEALHGDLSQAQRDAVMKRFKTRSMQMLVATDVAARGIDVNDLTHVMHHRLPDQLEAYTHRSGRTGRAGKKGISLAFIGPREERQIFELEKKIKVKFEKVEVPKLNELKSIRINHWANLIVNTKVDEQSDSMLAMVNDLFKDLSKEDILKRLITTQLDHLMIEGDDNLNESKSGNSEGRGERVDRGNFQRYFINIGTIDGMTKADVVHFLADTTNVDRKCFGDITIQKTSAFFNVEKDQAPQIEKSFVGFDLDGRNIFVNKEENERPERKSFGGGQKRRPRTHGSGGGSQGAGRSNHSGGRSNHGNNDRSQRSSGGNGGSGGGGSKSDFRRPRKSRG